MPLGVQKTRSRSDGGKLGPGAEVVEDLRQEAPDVDGVGRGEGHPAAEIAIGKGGLGELLTVVEGALDGQCTDVLAEGRELSFLEIADLSVGEEDDDPGVGETEERIGHRAAGVARGGDEDRESLFGAVACAHGPRHETRADILEGEGGPVEELELMDAVRQGGEGNREVERALDDLVEGFVVELIAEKMPRQGLGDGPEIRASEGRQGRWRDRVELPRRVEPAVGRHGLEERLAIPDGSGRRRWC